MLARARRAARGARMRVAPTQHTRTMRRHSTAAWIHLRNLAAGIMLLVAGLMPSACRANMYDVFEKKKLFPLQCESGCAPWAEVAAARKANNATWFGKIVDVDASFAAGKVPSDAGNLCAMPGMANPGEVGNMSWWDHVQAGFAGSFCFCR